MTKILRIYFSFLVILGAYSSGVHSQERTITIANTGGELLPWSYTKPDGTLAGFDIDLANELCRRAGLKCNIVSQSFQGLIPSLLQGKIDAILNGIAITEKRKEVVAFSIPYAEICYTFAALKDSDIAKRLPSDARQISLDDLAAVKTIQDELRPILSGKTIGTLASGTSIAFVNAYLGGIPVIRQYKTAEARDLDLVAGRVDFIVGTRDSLEVSAKKHGGNQMTLSGPCFKGSLIGEGFGIALRKSDGKLKEAFDAAIKQAAADGTIKKLALPVLGEDITPKSIR